MTLPSITQTFTDKPLKLMVWNEFSQGHSFPTKNFSQEAIVASKLMIQSGRVFLLVQQETSVTLFEPQVSTEFEQHSIVPWSEVGYLEDYGVLVYRALAKNKGIQCFKLIDLTSVRGHLAQPIHIKEVKSPGPGYYHTFSHSALYQIDTQCSIIRKYTPSSPQKTHNFKLTQEFKVFFAGFS